MKELIKENITNVDISTNNRLKEIREALNLTQKDFSDVLEVKQSYYSDVENGKREVTTRLIKNLISMFGYSADWILTGKGNKNITDIDNKDLSTAQQQNKKYSKKSDEFYESPFYLTVQIDKMLMRDLISENPVEADYYKKIQALSTFGLIIESIDHNYFNDIKLAQQNKNYYFKEKGFEYNQYKNAVVSEIKKVERFKPSIDKINQAIEEFYSEIQSLDDKNVVDGLFGRETI